MSPESGLRISEASWQTTVEDLAKLGGWRIYHTRDSRGSHAGFPDLVLLKPPRMVVAELKAESGRVSPAQTAWLADFAQIPGAEVYTWRPSEFDEARRVLLEGSS